MEFLGHLIEEKCATKLWIPVKASRSGLAFSYLFLADDLVLFANANPENCATINSVLQHFLYLLDSGLVFQRILHAVASLG